jgi:hypothetical protein
MQRAASARGARLLLQRALGGSAEKRRARVALPPAPPARAAATARALPGKRDA